jgi:hypothetical protein
MIRFAEVFPDEQIVSALRRQLAWTHFKSLIYLDDPLKRDFYKKGTGLHLGANCLNLWMGVSNSWPSAGLARTP